MSATAPHTLRRAQHATLAYHRLPGRSPGVVFLHGFMSDMTGVKATALEALCRRRGQAFVRFDCQGHGQSSGRMEDGTIGLWAADAVAVLDELTTGPQILVGSSMGGWLMLLAALARPERVAALVGIAAAPDFVLRMWDELADEARNELTSRGVHYAPTPYGPQPYVVTRALLEEGRRHLLLNGPIRFDGPVRLLQGMQDPDVPWQTAVALAGALTASDVEVQLVKDGDHRLSRPQDLERLCATVASLCDRLEGRAAPAE